MISKYFPLGKVEATFVLFQELNPFDHLLLKLEHKFQQLFQQ
jgi:hypothetical protein